MDRSVSVLHGVWTFFWTITVCIVDVLHVCCWLRSFTCFIVLSQPKQGCGVEREVMQIRICLIIAVLAHAVADRGFKGFDEGLLGGALFVHISNRSAAYWDGVTCGVCAKGVISDSFSAVILSIAGFISKHSATCGMKLRTLLTTSRPALFSSSPPALGCAFSTADADLFMKK